MGAERLGVSSYFLERLDDFLSRREFYEDLTYQRAARAIGEALTKTLRYIEAEQNGQPLPFTKDELSEAWQEASRVVTPLDRDFAMACYYKALGWLRPEEWAEADRLGIETDIDSIKAKRIKLIAHAKSEAQKSPEPESWVKWINEKEHRERLTFVFGIIGAIITALSATFVYFDGKSWVKSFFDTETTFYLCVGEHESECRANAKAGAAFQGCGADPVAWVKRAHPSECVSASANKISDVGGNRCGYATFEIKCHTR